MDFENKKQLRSKINASVFKGGYLLGMKNTEAVKKSTLQKQAQQKGDEQQIDDKTFRIMANFQKPPEPFLVYKQTGRCYLQKEGFFSCFSSRKPYDFQIKNSKMSISSSEKVYGFVDFNVVWADVERTGDGLVIIFQDCASKLYIEPATAQSSKQETCKKWFSMLKQIINTTQGKSKKLSYLAIHNPLDFFKTQHVINSEFEKMANTGDILLFKSQHSAASVQRVFTNSEYDHVGVILRNRKNELFIYESTSDTGVGFTAWKQLIRYEWYTQIDKLCWRQLSIKYSESDLAVIETFIIKTLGKEFQINLDKLLTFKSNLQRTSVQEDKKTYFCSQLVARLYKQLKILPAEKSSTSYYPVDFSQNGGLRIVRENVTLSNERLISFDRV